MGLWRSSNSTWKDSPVTPAVNTGPSDSDRLKALEDRWSAFAKQTRSYEERDRRQAGSRLVSHDLQQSQRAMMRSGGSINASEAAFREREDLFRQASRPYSFDNEGGLTSAKRAVGNAFKTGW